MNPMKIRSSILWFSVIVLTAIFLIVWYAKKRPESPTPAVTAPELLEDVSTALASQTKTNVDASKTNQQIVTAIGLTNAATVPQKSQEEITRDRFATENDVPIVFYGKLEDQLGNPVAGAEITGNTIINNGITNGHGRFSAMSDASGFFQMDAGRGADLGIMPKKEGYVLATARTSFKYSRMFNPDYFVPDSNVPVVIKMWKLQGAEHLIRFNIRTRIPIDGKPVLFDLHTGQLVQAGGDIAIQVKITIKPGVRQRYLWQATVQPKDGGIVPAEGRLDLRFQAPASDYESAFTLDNQTNDKDWSPSFHGGFYFKAHRDGVYGKFDLGIFTDVVKEDTIPVTLSGFINPAGSRNLEVNPALVTEAKP